MMPDEEFIVREPGATPARHVRLHARNATAAFTIAAELLDAWPGELEVWTTHYYSRALTPRALERAGELVINRRDPDSAARLTDTLQVDRHTRAHVVHELEAHARPFRLRTVLGAVEQTLADWRACCSSRSVARRRPTCNGSGIGSPLCRC